ncbi:hypothetical protein [Rhodococcus sp. NCIMB 12038]|uniref:hypothetical protein n=1 Tax=Rhodococcus sp. NCIMB 12038 TaxID=933800 RepID=UPI000B3CF800|nr:hypothetical protein [Rhodococcus sp. NCIMB 12038]OUS91920.1 hypothetical protein CA951_31100 [Rhodococcus sp. NCIMB 12038]
MRIALRVLGLAIIGSMIIGVVWGMPSGTTDPGEWWRQGAPVDPDAIYRNFRWPGCQVADCSHMYFNDDVFAAATASAVSVVGRPGAQLWNMLAANSVFRWIIPIIAAFVVGELAKSIWTILIRDEKKNEADD